MAAEALALIRMRRRRLENETGADERFDGNVGVGPTDESGKSSSSLIKRSWLKSKHGFRYVFSPRRIKRFRESASLRLLRGAFALLLDLSDLLRRLI